jgi:hypothetical protein
MTTASQDLQRELARLLPRDLTWVEWNEDVGMFGVIAIFDGDEDIIGSGESESEAIEDAIRTVRGWESSR